VTSNTEAQEPTSDAPGPSSEKVGRKNGRTPVLIGVSVVAIVALVAAVWFGIGYANALSDKSAADTRDSALTGAQQVAINLNTVDAANIDQSFDDMKSSITGDTMLNDLESTRSSINDAVRTSGAKMSAELMHATLTELSADDGTATALVVIAATTTWPDRPAQKVKQTMRLFMEDVDGTWKANKVDPIGTPIALDASGGQTDSNGLPLDPGGVPAPTADPADPNAITPSAEEPAPVPDATGGQ
jgi:Mce-associated membrane protein